MVQISDEKLCLQWIGFQAYLTSAFGDLRNDKEFTDVTLACEDGQQVEVHKLVLISSSPFFKNLLHRNKHPHPLIYMRGVKSEDLVAMIDFLYQGEANVYQENLDSFLAIAEELKLKGLHGNQTEAVHEESVSNTRAHESYARTTFSKETVTSGDGSYKPHPNNRKFTNKLENESNQETAIALNCNSTGYTDIAELSEKVKSMMSASENPAPNGQQGKARICNVCGKEGQYQNITGHIEANHLAGIALPCNNCGKIVASRHALAQHKIICKCRK